MQDAVYCRLPTANYQPDSSVCQYILGLCYWGFSASTVY